MIKGTQLLQLMDNLLNDQLLSSGYIHMDETPVQGLNEPGKTAESKRHMGVGRTGNVERYAIRQ
jgi:transposase